MLIEDECLCGAVFSVAGSFADCAAIHDRWITAHRVCRNQAAHDAASAAPEDQHSEPGRIPAGWKLVPVEPTDLQCIEGRVPEDVNAKYHELLYAVATKHPGETRHETALRYIMEREHPVFGGPMQAAAPEPDGEKDDE